MNVQDAVFKAKTYVSDLFSDENISDLGLEEVFRDDQNGEWVVTLGFARPWDKKPAGFSGAIQGIASPGRSYKLVRINDERGDIISITSRG